MSILLITHDLGVVAEMCDRVAVMYAGRVVEDADIETLFDYPQHPYTLGLMGAAPRPDAPDRAPVPIPGAPPDMAHPPGGCPFHPRCRFAEDICRVDVPIMQETAPGHRTACHFAGAPHIVLESEAMVNAK